MTPDERYVDFAAHIIANLWVTDTIVIKMYLHQFRKMLLPTIEVLPAYF